MLQQSSLRTLDLKNLSFKYELPESQLLEAIRSYINMSFINFHAKLVFQCFMFLFHSLLKQTLLKKIIASNMYKGVFKSFQISVGVGGTFAAYVPSATSVLSN